MLRKIYVYKTTSVKICKVRTAENCYRPFWRRHHAKMPTRELAVPVDRYGESRKHGIVNYRVNVR